MSVEPLRDFILVLKEQEEERSPGSLIYKPATAEQKVVRGKVVAVGSGRLMADGKVVPLEVVVGDIIVFNKHFATEISDGANTFLLLKEEQVLCVVR